MSTPLTLVTGASSGIGRQVAIRLSQSRSLLLHGRDQSRLEETLSLCSPGQHYLWNFDFENVSGLRGSLNEFCRESNLTISEFVHCAGLPSVGAARMTTVEKAQKTFNVNTISALEIVATLLRKTNHESLRNIVFISSIWSGFGSTGHSIYSATKGALDSAMRSLAVELAPTVRVNSLALGAIDSPMAHSALSDPEIQSHTQSNYPLGLGTTEDAAEACIFLLSDSAKWITGQVILVDGGRTAHMSNK